MPFEPGQSGNPSGSRKTRRFEQAILAEIAALEGDDLPKGLRRIAARLVKAADGGDEKAIAEIANRVDGKSAQQIIHSGDSESPLVVEIVRLSAEAAK